MVGLLLLVLNCSLFVLYMYPQGPIGLLELNQFYSILLLLESLPVIALFSLEIILVIDYFHLKLFQ